MRKHEGGRHDRKRLKIRWATWWPVRYWTERFTELAARPEIDLDVVFLSSSSDLLPLKPSRTDWKFKFKIIRKESSKSGYTSVYRRVPKPWKLVEGDFDYLVIPYGDPDFVAAAFLCRLMGKPYILFIPNNKFDRRPNSISREFLKKYIYRHAVGCLATGKNQLEYARSYLSPDQSLRLVGNPAPHLEEIVELSGLACREEMRSAMGWSGKFVVLFVGRLSEEKGLYDLMASLKEPGLSGKQVHTVIVGNGPCEMDLRSVAEGIESDVEFKRFVTGNALTKLYLSADIFVLPSHSEPWGLVVNEAMEAGLPVVISSNVGAGDSLVRHGSNGFVFKTGDVGGLADCISELLDNGEMRAKMAKRGKDVVERHSIERWADAVVASFEV